MILTYMQRKTALIILISVFPIQNCFAAEIDSVTPRKLELDNSIDLWGFTNLINQHYSKPRKLQVIEMIWEVIYADGELSLRRLIVGQPTLQLLAEPRNRVT